MATLGRNALLQYALPANWDAGELSKVRLQSGETYEELLTEITNALDDFNGVLLSEQPYAGLVSVTDEMALEYPIGVSNAFQEHTEYSRPDAKRGATTGHMLPLKAYDFQFGWTWDMLRKARRAQIDADIAMGIAEARNIWQKTILTKLFRSTRQSVGSSGYDMPFCDGGTADPSYVPPYRPDRGGIFTSSHTHYLALNGITQANVTTAVEHLWEHGHDGPYDMLVSRSDISSWTNTTNVTGYIRRPDPLIQYGQDTDVAKVDAEYLGVINTDYGVIRVRACGRIPTTYYALYKSYGPMDERNPLKVRRSTQFPLGVILLAGDHIRQFPLENAILFFEFGVGCGADRTAAVLCQNTSGSWSDPTIS